MIVAVGRYTPTEVYPPWGDKWEAFGFRTVGELDRWLDDAGLWYPDAIIVEVAEPCSCPAPYGRDLPHLSRCPAPR